MSNIVKELKKDRSKQDLLIDQDKAVHQVLLLEEKSSAEDLRIARALGSSHSIARAETELGKKLDLERLEGKYKGDVFTAEQIQRLARKYNMRFLASRYYCGNIDLSVIQAIKDFNKDTGVEITDGNIQGNFFILAPENCFKLEKMKKVRVDPDPAIFYYIGDDKYRLVKQWGSDFSFLNRVAGWNWATRTSKFWLHTIICAIIMIPFVLFAPWYISGPLGLIMIICNNVKAFSSDWSDNLEYHDQKWNSAVKLVK